LKLSVLKRTGKRLFIHPWVNIEFKAASNITSEKENIEEIMRM